jgi:tRNA (mo5U34)-methyltransferase
MLKELIRRGARRLGYDILKVPRVERIRAVAGPPPAEPVWPLPRAEGGPGDAEMEAAFAAHPSWHYAYAFEGGLSFPTSHTNPGPDTNDPIRPLQRFRHFMPWLIDAAGGTLRGKRVLDIGCNSGFWSIQCALLGAEVVGFDARPELIAQANLLKRITGATGAEFRLLDFDRMSPGSLGGTFDIVLNLGILYHLPEPARALAMTKKMSRRHILLDTAVYPSDDFLVYLKWEEPYDIRMAAREGMVALPSRRSVELMLRHIGARRWLAIPVRSKDVPDVYRTNRRASWLVEV